MVSERSLKYPRILKLVFQVLSQVFFVGISLCRFHLLDDDSKPPAPQRLSFIILKFSNKYMKALSTKAASVDSKQSYFKTNYVSSQSYRQTEMSKQIDFKSGDKYQENEDLDWLEKLVHGFQWYKDKKNNLFNEDKLTINSGKNLDNSFAKIQLNQSCQRHSQRKTLNDITKKYIQKSKQIKQQVLNKNANLTKNTIKAKRIQSQSSTKKKNFEYSKLKQRESKKQNSIENSKCVEKYLKTGDFVQTNDELDPKTQLWKMKSKMSMLQNRNKLSFSKKIVNVKASRKDFIQAVVQTKKNYGKIVKNNKSLELKEKKRGDEICDSKKNIISVANILEKKQPKNHQLRQATFLSEENILKVVIKPPQNEKQKSLQRFLKQSEKGPEKSEKNHSEVNQSSLGKQNKQDCLIQPNNKIKQFDKIYLSQKPITKQGQEVQKELQFKKYKYYIQFNDKKTQSKQKNSSLTKKQRKLNSSFGQRRMCNRQNIMTVKTTSLTKLQQSRITDNKEKYKVCNSVLITNSKDLQDTKYSSNKNQNNQKQNGEVKEKQNQRFKDLYNHNVKFVQSTKNSQILTEQSYVIQRPHFQNDQYFQSAKTMKSYDTDQEWNIMQIFSKLDSLRIGILKANNCSIQNVSREIRYILGPVLEEILHKNVNYSFSQFINRVQDTLQSIKDSASHLPKFNSKQIFHQFSKEQLSQKFKFRKQKGLGLQQFKQVAKTPSNTSSKTVQASNTLSHKKYDYSKTFIDNIETQPTLTNKIQNKTIRFATFQDEQFIQKQEDQKKKGKDTNYINFKNQREKSMQEKLEQKLQNLNEFRSILGTTQHLAMKGEGQYPKVKPRIESERRIYQNQIVKLQMLNKRLQKYLVDQTLKQFSASKLLIQDI